MSTIGGRDSPLKEEHSVLLRSYLMLGILIVNVACCSGCSAGGRTRESHQRGETKWQSRIDFLDEDGQRIWGVSLTALAAECIDTLGRLPAERALLLPAFGERKCTFPDSSKVPFRYPHGTVEAEREYQERVHKEQSLRSVQQTIEDAFAYSRVPMVSRDAEAVRAILAEADLAATFGKPEDAARLGRLASADAICMIRYDAYYDVHIEYDKAGLPLAVNSWRGVLTLKCVRTDNGQVALIKTIDTSEILRNPRAFAAADPYRFFVLSLIDPEYAKTLPEPTLISSDLLVARAIVLVSPAVQERFRDAERARALLDQVKQLPPVRDPLDLLQARLLFASAIHDRPAFEAARAEAEALMGGRSQWWQDLYRRNTYVFSD